MWVNIQRVLNEQKANFDHFNELKTLISSTIPRILDIFLVKKLGEWCLYSRGCPDSNKYGIYRNIRLTWCYGVLRTTYVSVSRQ